MYDVQPTYVPARSNTTHTSHSAAAAMAYMDNTTSLLEAEYRPTFDECALLTEPIAYFLSQCTCYDVIGISTQVVVLDVDTTLAVAFIAAQEARVQSCVLWDVAARTFVGVLSAHDYIRILLYCEANPREAAAVSSWTIRHWLSVQHTITAATLTAATTAAAATGSNSNSSGNATTQTATTASPRQGAQPSPSSSSSQPSPSATRPFVSCKTDTSLKDCLHKMHHYNVRRIVALAEKEAGSMSVVAMLDVEHIVEHIGVMFFHVEKAGAAAARRRSLAARRGSSSDGGGSGGGVAAGGESTTTMDVRSGSLDDDNAAAAAAAVHGGVGMSDLLGAGAGGGGGGVVDVVAASSHLHSRHHRHHHHHHPHYHRGEDERSSDDLDVGVDDDDDDDAAASEEAAMYGFAEATLPPHVTSILYQVEANKGTHGEPRVGPYRSIFDVPFALLPCCVGGNSARAVYVTPEQPLHVALLRMLQHRLESIAVCNEELVIVDVISQSDLLRMEDQGVYDTTLTVRQALASKLRQRTYVFYAKDTLRDIFTHFVRRRVKELFLVDADTGRLQGQLNIAELIFFLVFGGNSSSSSNIGGVGGDGTVSSAVHKE